MRRRTVRAFDAAAPDPRALRAAYCTGVGTLVMHSAWRADMAAMSPAGPTAYPTRNPVMACDFENDCVAMQPGSPQAVGAGAAGAAPPADPPSPASPCRPKTYSEYISSLTRRSPRSAAMPAMRPSARCETTLPVGLFG